MSDAYESSSPRRAYSCSDREAGTPPTLPISGAIAQLEERLDRTQEVAGSSPASSISNSLRRFQSVSPSRSEAKRSSQSATKPKVSTPSRATVSG